MKTVLYINHGLGKNCGVYDLGVRHFNILKKSKKYNFVYKEIDDFNTFSSVCDELIPNMVMFNYMPFVMGWINDNLNYHVNYKKIEIVHLFTKTDPSTSRLFDYHILLDPTSTFANNVDIFKTNRPVLEYKNLSNNKISNPVKIGSFGFAFDHKNFDRVCKLVNDSFDNAIINLHMPEAKFNGNSQGNTHNIINRCKANINKPGIILNHTDTYLTETEIIDTLNKNDINVLLYESSHTQGISSSIDYLISAQKPVLISKCEMFRHVNNKLPEFPDTNIVDIVNNYEYYCNIINDVYTNIVGNILIETENILDKIDE